MATFGNGYADHLWDQFPAVVKRYKEGKQFSEEVTGFIKQRVVLEKEYAMKLQKLIKSTTSEEQATLGAAWSSIRSETEKLAHWHDQFAERLQAEVKERITDFSGDHAKQAKPLIDQGTKILKELESQTEKRDKTRSAFERARKKQDESQDEYERATLSGQPANVVQKLAKKVGKDEKASIKADNIYKASIATLVDAQTKAYETDMPKTLSEMQRLEEERVHMTQMALDTIVTLQKSLAECVTERCTYMRQAVQAVNPKGDAMAFIERVATWKEKPAKAEYEPYDPTKVQAPEKSRRLSLVAPLSFGGNKDKDNSPSNSRSMSISSPMSSGPSLVPPGGVQPQQPMFLAASKPGVMARALFDYTGETEAELSFKQGEIIKVTEKDDSGWWQGELNGAIGAFPNGWVEELVGGVTLPVSPQMTMRPVPVQMPNAAEKKARALFDFVAESPEEVNMRVGDALVVELEDDGSGWLYGTNKNSGEKGRFPSNYVERH